MVKISKELFCDTLNKIKEEYEKYHKADNALGIMMDGFPVLTIGDGYLDALIDVLVEVCGDIKKDSVIEWWLFEDVEKKIWIKPNTKFNKNDKELELDVSTPEKLYDYFVNYN